MSVIGALLIGFFGTNLYDSSPLFPDPLAVFCLIIGIFLVAREFYPQLRSILRSS